MLNIHSASELHTQPRNHLLTRKGEMQEEPLTPSNVSLSKKINRWQIMSYESLGRGYCRARKDRLRKQEDGERDQETRPAGRQELVEALGSLGWNGVSFVRNLQGEAGEMLSPGLQALTVLDRACEYPGSHWCRAA